MPPLTVSADQFSPIVPLRNADGEIVAGLNSSMTAELAIGGAVVTATIEYRGQAEAPRLLRIECDSGLPAQLDVERTARDVVARCIPLALKAHRGGAYFGTSNVSAFVGLVILPAAKPVTDDELVALWVASLANGTRQRVLAQQLGVSVAGLRNRLDLLRAERGEDSVPLGKPGRPKTSAPTEPKNSPARPGRGQRKEEG